jgi:DNA-binding sugar fermentation-stimulating protein
MAVSGQLCRVAEGLSYKDITLAHRHPPPSPQKSEKCAKHVQFLNKMSRHGRYSAVILLHLHKNRTQVCIAKRAFSTHWIFFGIDRDFKSFSY